MGRVFGQTRYRRHDSCVHAAAFTRGSRTASRVGHFHVLYKRQAASVLSDFTDPCGGDSDYKDVLWCGRISVQPQRCFLTKYKKTPQSVADLLRGDSSVAKVVQFQVQAFQAPRRGLQVLGQDLLELPGYGGYGDGIPHLEQHGLVSRWRWLKMV